MLLFLLIFAIRGNDDEALAKLFKRTKVHHPIATMNKEDIKRANENVEKHQWAKTAKRRILSSADSIITLFNESFLDTMIPKTTPAALTFCPNCAKRGNDYHPNGQWSWTVNDPHHITCSKCKMVFPNTEYPEELQFASKWDPEQTITYINTGPKQCMNYFRCYSSVNGVIRRCQLDYTIKRLTLLSQAYVLSNDLKYARTTKRFLIKLAERFRKYMVYCGYSYNQYADCDPRYAVQHLPNLPIIEGEQCKMIAAGFDTEQDTFFSDYWSAGRFGSSGSDGEYVEIIALAYDLVADALDENGLLLFSEDEKKLIEEDLLIESCLLGYFDKTINNKSTLNMKGCSLVGLVVGNSELVKFGLDGYNKVFDEFFLKDGTTSQSVTYGLKTLLGFDGFHLAFRNYTSSDTTEYLNYNINRDTEYESLWQSYMWCMYYNTTYPILGDQSQNQVFPLDYYEFLTMEFKHKYMQEFIGSLQSQQESPRNNALFLRDPDYVPYDGPFVLPDYIYPYLQQGFIRSGEYGDESLLILDASPGDGGHHHYDSLNVVYTKYGNELLLDLGYLLDHPNKSKTMATVAHNTVLIDGEDQQIAKRGGQFHLFDSSFNDTRVMQASSKPYENCTIYHRTLVQIEHEKSRNYIVDIFRADGGSKRRELVFHGPNNQYSFNQVLTFDTPYNIEIVQAYIMFAIRVRESFEIADISMYELLENGTKGIQLLKPIPETIETLVSNHNCSEQSFYCGRYTKASSLDYTIISKDENSKAIKVQCNSEKCSGNLYVGHECNQLELKGNSRYCLEFKLRGTSFVKNIRLQIGDQTLNLVKQTLWDIYPDKWTFFSGYFDVGAPFSEALGTTTNDPFTVNFNVNEQTQFSVFVPARVNQKIYFKNGWGQRYNDNRDFGATLPYFFITHDSTEKLSTWITVYEGYNTSQNLVENVEATYDQNGNAIAKIYTKDGIDYVSSSFDGIQNAEGFGLKSNAKVAVINNGKIRFYEGSYFEFNKSIIQRDQSNFTGKILSNGNSNDKNNSWFELDREVTGIRQGQILFVEDEGGVSRGYPIQSVSGNRIFVKSQYKGFKSYPALTWHLIDLVTEYDEVQSPSSNDPAKIDNKKKLSGGAIAGIVISVIVVIASVFVGIIFYLRYKQSQEEDSLMEITKHSFF